MKKTVITFAVAMAVAIYGYVNNASSPAETVRQQSSSSDKILQHAYENRKSDIQAKGSGVVVRVLSDDTRGSRHQRFILRLSSGQKLLVSHNIDLAPKITSLQKGDRVEFYGEYEYNAKGGLIHWTHHDPNRRHADGWLQHKGRIYQ